MKRIIIITIFIASCTICFAQNYNIQQNQQNVNINVPVIEKTVYVDRYRTVYVEKPRTDRKLSGPVLLLGYLCVFPEDIGDYQSHPTEIINAVNRQNLYGRNTWRIPTHDELMLMEANADQLGMGDHIYMATSHANGHLRLVSTESNISHEDGYVVGNIMWSDKNFGADTITDFGMEVDSREFSENMLCHVGWRLPTKQEFKMLILKCGRFRTIATDNNRLIVSLLYPKTCDFYLPVYSYYGTYGGLLSNVHYLVKNGEVKLSVPTGGRNAIVLSDETMSGLRIIDYDISRSVAYMAEDVEECSYPYSGYVRCVRDL